MALSVIILLAILSPFVSSNTDGELMLKDGKLCHNCLKENVETSAIPQGYQLFPKVGFYRFYSTPKTWGEGQMICHMNGGHLAIINSEEEMNVLKDLFALYPNIWGGNGNFASVGFHDLLKEGEYMTVKGESLYSTGYYHWSVGEPNNYGKNENCGSMGREGGLNDVRCSELIPFVCEIELCENFV